MGAGGRGLVAAPALSFARIDVVVDAPDAGAAGRSGLIEIELRGGARVRVDSEVSEPALTRVRPALKAVS